MATILNMENLPCELRGAVLQQMDSSTLQAMRLTSKFWANLGEEYLIAPTFTTLHHRDDFSRLLSLSQHPQFSRSIQRLFINLSELDEYQARNLTTFPEHFPAQESLRQQGLIAYGVVEQSKLFFHNCCSPEILRPAFSSLPNLHSIDISLSTCPFEEDLLQQAWLMPDARLLNISENCNRFHCILDAVVCNLPKLTITNLSHDRLPFAFFIQSVHHVPRLPKAFHSLESLSLTIDCSEDQLHFHSAHGFDTLSVFLRAAPLLRTLHLTFECEEKVCISPLLSSLQSSHFSFPVLEDLKLAGLSCTAIELGDFLVAQKQLRRLRLGGDGVLMPGERAKGGVYLMEGSFAALFRRLRTEMHLDVFQLHGDLVAVESGEWWQIDPVMDQEKWMQSRKGDVEVEM